MKRIEYIKISLLALFTVMIAGCTDFDDLNRDPTTSTNMAPDLQIPTIQLFQTNETDMWHRFFIYPGGFMDQWTQDWATVWYGGTGVKNKDYFAFYWDMYYMKTIKNAVDLEMRTRGIAEYTNINAMARILKVQNFLRLTDLYGDIPYFDAGTALETGNFTPKYDTQKDIYDDFFKTLEEAANSLSKEFPQAKYDLYYNGDIDKWKRLANSLRLRIAMRLIKVDKARAEKEVQAAVAGGVFTSNDDICYVKHGKKESGVVASEGNAVSNLFFKHINFCFSRELIMTMEELGDPRIRYYGTSRLDNGPPGSNTLGTDITDLMIEIIPTLPWDFPTPEEGRGKKYWELTIPARSYSYELPVGEWRGEVTLMIGGQEVIVSRVEQVLRPSQYIVNWDAPYIHLSYAEVEFLLAEACVRGYIAGDAKTHFKNGLEAAVNQWKLFGVNVSADAVSDFVAKNDLKTGNQALEQIGTQLWVLNVLDPLETWSNWRRMGQPEIKPYAEGKGDNSEGQLPRRIEYPMTEQVSNHKEWRKAVDRMGGVDSWLSRVWWDVDVKE